MMGPFCMSAMTATSVLRRPTKKRTTIWVRTRHKPYLFLSLEMTKGNEPSHDFRAKMLQAT